MLEVPPGLACALPGVKAHEPGTAVVRATFELMGCHWKADVFGYQ